MEYTVQALAELSGVTPRTLRWYDRIGLLKPGRVGENGYRYYGPAQVDRLQDILYYRALGVPLEQIKASLDDPSFDRLAGPAGAPGRPGGGAGTPGGADPVGEDHHPETGKERDHERRGEI